MGADVWAVSELLPGGVPDQTFVHKMFMIKSAEFP